MEEKSVLSAWLKTLRATAKLSQAQAAQAIGVDSREIRRWETGEAPNAFNLLLLLNAYGVEFSQAPPRSLPGAVNAELRKAEQTLRGNRRHLEELQAAVAELAVSQEKILSQLAARRTGGAPHADGPARPASASAARRKPA